MKYSGRRGFLIGWQTKLDTEDIIKSKRMIKRYLKTFSKNTPSGKARIFAFNLFSLCIGLLVSLCFVAFAADNFGSYCWIVENQVLVMLLSVLIGYSFTLIVDLTVGFGRKSPLLKNNEKI